MKRIVRGEEGNTRVEVGGGREQGGAERRRSKASGSVGHRKLLSWRTPSSARGLGLGNPHVVASLVLGDRDRVLG